MRGTVAAGVLRRLAAAGAIVVVLAGVSAARDAAPFRVAVPVDGGIVGTVADGIADEALLGSVASVIIAKLGLPLPSPLYAYFYESAEAFEEGLIRDGGADPAMAKDHTRFAIGVGSGRGIFLRRDRLVITSFNGRTGLYAHELAHVAQATLAGGRRVPSEQWLREGHADWVKYQVLEQLGLQAYERSRARMIREIRFGAVANLPRSRACRNRATGWTRAIGSGIGKRTRRRSSPPSGWSSAAGRTRCGSIFAASGRATA